MMDFKDEGINFVSEVLNIDYSLWGKLKRLTSDEKVKKFQFNVESYTTHFNGEEHDSIQGSRAFTLFLDMYETTTENELRRLLSEYGFSKPDNLKLRDGSGRFFDYDYVEKGSEDSYRLTFIRPRERKSE